MADSKDAEPIVLGKRIKRNPSFQIMDPEMLNKSFADCNGNGQTTKAGADETSAP
jgi:hypothetical protein